MAHRSRLSQARSELSCIICGCTEDNSCITADGPCRWVYPGLCSNPECLAKFEAEFGADVPEIRDSRYMGFDEFAPLNGEALDDFAARRAEDFEEEEVLDS